MSQLEGLERVTQNLNKVIKETIGASRKGLMKVGFEIKGISMRNTPVDLGNLRASHYIIWNRQTDNSAPLWKDDPIDAGKMVKLKNQHPLIVNSEMSNLTDDDVQVGVSAFYAVKQHEDMSLKHRVGKAKFLEDAIQQVIPKAAKIVASEAKIDGG